MNSIVTKYNFKRLPTGVRVEFWHILIPVVIESLINALFVVIDTMMLGQAPDATRAIAAVGVTLTSITVVVNVMTGFCSGFTVYIAQSYGAGDREACRRAARSSLPLMALVGAGLSMAGVLLAPGLIRLLGANAEIAPDATAYFRITSLGFFAQAITITVCAVFRGVGQTRLPLLFNIGAGALKVFLNFCLIGGKLGFPPLRVTGAAIATVSAKTVAGVAALLLFLLIKTPVQPRQKGERLTLTDFLPHRPLMKRVMQVGLFAGAEQIVLQGGNVVTTGILTVVPTAAYAAYQVSISLQELIWAFATSFGIAVTSLAGQLLGRNHLDQINGMARMAMKYAMIACGGIVLLYLLAGKALAGVFSDDPAVVEDAVHLLWAYCLPAVAIFMHSILSGVLRGLSRPQGPLIASLISLWLFRVAGSLVTVRVFMWGAMAACLCNGADQIARAVLNWIFYFRTTAAMHRRKEIKEKRLGRVHYD